MTLSLNKQFQDFIDAEIAAGRYASETEVVEDALRELMERTDTNRLRRRLLESERQIERGEFVIADDAFFESKRQMIRDQYMPKAK
jgi:putative addiction module CopG family antidote